LLDVALCSVAPAGDARDAQNARSGRLACFVPHPTVEAAHSERRKGVAMDVLYLGLTVVFFLVSWALVEACDHLS
jgi:hypothetical protein